MEELINKFLEKVVLSVHHLEKALDYYIEGDKKKFLLAVENTSKAELEADKIRREIELSLFNFRLLPFSRADYITLLEMTDDIADKAEITSKLLSIYKPKISRRFVLHLTKLMSEVCQTVETLRGAILALNTDLDAAKEKADYTEVQREIARKIEFKTLEEIFSSREKDLTKYTLRQLVSLMGSIADKAEETSDLVSIFIVKYKG